MRQHIANHRHVSFVFGLFTLVFAGLNSTELFSQDFRLETDVFVGSEKEPTAQNLTLFADGLVYDFLLTTPEEITVFDPPRGRFILLHTGKKLKTTLTTDDLLSLVSEMRAREPGDKQRAFFLDPQFEESFEPSSKELILKSRPLTYRVKGEEPKDKSAIQKYREFADWYARLNSVMSRGNLPPFSRIHLNKAIAEKSWIPTEIHRTLVIRDKLIERRFDANTRHLVNWLISNTDRKRIESVSELIANYQSVPPKEFLDATQPVGNKTATR